jgi:hypothetical protein
MNDLFVLQDLVLKIRRALQTVSSIPTRLYGPPDISHIFTGLRSKHIHLNVDCVPGKRAGARKKNSPNCLLLVMNTVNGHVILWRLTGPHRHQKHPIALLCAVR